MIKILNNTQFQRIYDLSNGTTLRVDAHSFSEPIEDNLVSDHIKSDEKLDKIDIISITGDTPEDTPKTKGGKK